MIFCPKIRIVLLASLFLSYSGIMLGQSPYEIILKADALNKAGNPESAISILTSSINIKPDSRLYQLRGESFLLKGDYNSASENFIAANNLKTGSGNYGLAKVSAIKGDAGSAIRYLENEMKSPSRRNEKDIMLDPAFSLIENSAEWRKFWKTEWYSASEKYLTQVEFYLKNGKKDEATELISAMEKEYAGYPETIYGKALMFIFTGNYTDAVKSVSGLLTAQPENEQYLKLLADAQFRSSNFAGASVTYSKLIELEIPDAGLLLKRAECYKNTEEFRNASADVEKYLSFYPSDKAAVKLAGSIKSASGDNLGALKFYSDNIKIHPGEADCYIDRAYSYLKSKSWDMAIKDLSMSLDLDPKNSEVWLNKGIALINSGNDNDACHDFRMSFNLGNKKATEYISRHCIK
mgnify:CR=1 FL=1